VVPDEEVITLTAKVRSSHVRVLDAYGKANRMSRAAVARLAIEEFVSRPEVRSAAETTEEKTRRRSSA
jgi:predicted transcriptional regulator